jgi:uncharacterized membrane protein
MSFIIKSWNGEEALWKVWLFGYPLTWLLLMFGFILNQQLNISLGLSISVGVISYLWLLVAVWQCSDNAKKRIWFYLNRGLVSITVACGIGILLLKVNS